jgi:primase-polymerase (primpol)-like protein
VVIPAELFAYKQWVLWKRLTVQGRATKIPISPWSGRKAACDQPRSWSSFKHAHYVRKRWDCDGIGFVFTEQDPYCGIDLDRCRDEAGHFTPQALAILEKLNSFAELSPSGRGLHILVKAKLPAGRRRRHGIEMYDSGRYFTITGKHIPGTSMRIEDRQNAAEQLNSELFPVAAASIETVVNVSLDLSDKELIDKAHRARSGSLFGRLWAGDTSDYDGDHSRADAALCCMLAFWTKKDPVRIDALFRSSGLMRDKWDRQTGDCTYGARTIRIVLGR